MSGDDLKSLERDIGRLEGRMTAVENQQFAILTDLKEMKADIKAIRDYQTLQRGGKAMAAIIYGGLVTVGGLLATAIGYFIKP